MSTDDSAVVALLCRDGLIEPLVPGRVGLRWIRSDGAELPTSVFPTTRLGGSGGGVVSREGCEEAFAHVSITSFVSAELSTADPRGLPFSSAMSGLSYNSSSVNWRRHCYADVCYDAVSVALRCNIW
jgi:hypothetical protein